MKKIKQMFLGTIMMVLAATSSAGEVYLEGALGYNYTDNSERTHVEYTACKRHHCDTFTTVSDTGMGKNLGKVVLGNQWDSGVFIEAEHVSDTQKSDLGMNAVWLGLRKSWRY